MNSKNFASDNNSGVHPLVLKAMQEANQGHVVAYGDDIYTERAVIKFKECFGQDIEVFFVFNGTAANVLGLKAMTQTFNSIICSANSHINYDECCAPELFTGCKLLTIPPENGKISAEQIKHYLHGFGDQHHAQPKVISIAQATEFGTVYKPDEILELAKLAQNNDLLLHMDGARVANASASLNLSLKEITADVGVDVLSFGGTKNGLMYGEAIIFFNKSLAKNFKYIRKQGLQLSSKMRFIASQFEALLTDNLWLTNANHANKMAKILEEKLKALSFIKITRNVDSNGVFAIIPKEMIAPLQEKYFFYVWDETISEVRWMCSFDTTEEDIESFVKFIKKFYK